MSTEAKIMAAAAALGVPARARFWQPEANDPLPERFIVYNLVAETPVTFASDHVLHAENTVDVHLYAKDPPILLRGQLRDALLAQGLLWLNTVEQYEQDTRYTHITVTIYDSNYIRSD